MNSLFPKKRVIMTILFIILGGLFISFNIEKYSIKKVLPQPYIVKKNPYLAAEYYLKQRHKVVTINNNIQFFKALSSKKQTVILLGDGRKFSSSQNELILNWVKEGGTLIIEALKYKSKNNNNSDELLNSLGIKVEGNRYEADGELYLYIENEKDPVKLIFWDYRWRLIDEKNIASYWMDTEEGNIKLLQFPYGKGKITVLSSSYIWVNAIIGLEDNAWLLSYLTTDYPDTILYIQTKNIESPSLLLAMIKHYPYTLFISISLILLIIWRKIIRSGPLEAVQEKNSRQLSLQLNAEGNFLYKQIGQQQLISLLQREIYSLVEKRMPHFNKLASDDQYIFLNKLTQQPVTTLRKIMTPLTSHSHFSEVEFTRIIIVLQAIRNAL